MSDARSVARVLGQFLPTRRGASSLKQAEKTGSHSSSPRATPRVRRLTTLECGRTSDRCSWQRLEERRTKGWLTCIFAMCPISWRRAIYHLRAIIHVPAKRVSGQLSAVKHHLSLKLNKDGMAFTDRQNGVVKLALLAASRSSKEELIHMLEKSKRSAKLPAPDELLNECLRYGMHDAQGYDNFYGIHKRAVV